MCVFAWLWAQKLNGVECWVIMTKVSKSQNYYHMNNDNFLLANSHEIKKNHDEEGLSTFRPYWPMIIRGGCKGRSTQWLAALLTNLNITWPKKSDVISDNKSLRLHLNARDFSQHKSKMSAGCLEAVQLRVCGYLEQKMPFFATGKPPNTDYKPEGQ